MLVPFAFLVFLRATEFSFIVAALCNRAGHYIFALWFLLSIYLLSTMGVCQTAALNRGRHLYSAGRPSCWALAALAHISSLLSSSSTYPFPRLISAVADWMSTILPHMVWP